ncbi:MAG: carbohydrate ABC transporter permease [Acetanaerobacterium sp.]
MKTRISRVSLHIVLIFLTGLMVLPLIWVVLMSLKSTQDIMTTSVFSLPSHPMIENYVAAWVDGHIGEYFFNSIFITSTTTIFVIAFGTMCAYALARLRWKRRNVFFTIILLGLMIPIHATLIPVFMILRNLHLLNTYLCLILPYIAAGLPMAIFIFRNFMMGIPKEMEEAACIDGCGVWRSFLLIILPIIRPAIITVIILTFMNFWNEFVVASTIVQRQALNTLPIGLQAFQGEFSVNWGAMSAGIVISIIPVLICYILFNDIIDKSVVAGALK